MEEDNWDEEKLSKAMDESKEELMELHIRFFNLLVDFDLMALKTFQVAKSEPLNHIEIKKIVKKEMQIAIETFSRPDFVDLITEKAEFDFIRGSSQPLKSKRKQ